ncbi:MAG: hypothetical protein KGK03_01725 [Candidatus Omnitrophica bacterium]|nr:hypothetical protein [Candidatus Omnitrophota bacterium]
MKLTLKKISIKSFTVIFASINVIAGFILGTIVTIVSLVSPPEQGASQAGVWAILLFPIFNGLLGLATSAFLAGLYNLLAGWIGGVEMEYEAKETPSTQEQVK